MSADHAFGGRVLWFPLLFRPSPDRTGPVRGGPLSCRLHQNYVCDASDYFLGIKGGGYHIEGTKRCLPQRAPGRCIVQTTSWYFAEGPEV